MDIEFLTGSCMALETAEVFVRYVNREDYQGTKSKMLTRYGARFSENSKVDFIERIDTVGDAYAKVIPRIDITPQVERMFKRFYYDNTDSIIASIILLNFGDMMTTSVSDYLDSCIEKWKKKMQEKVHLKMVVASALIFAPGDVALKDCLASDIDALPYPHELKWNLLMLMQNFEQHVLELKEMLVSIEPDLKRAMNPLEVIVEDMRDFWKENMREELIYELADSMCLQRKDIVDKKVALQILRMPCDQAIIDDQREGNYLPVLLGVSIEWGHQFIDEHVDVGLLCEELRILGEESKFQIMQLLKKEASYGQEIARKLDLDAATVSRHLTALQRCGLIYVDHREKRNIYYKVNKKELRNLAETLQRIFFE